MKKMIAGLLVTLAITACGGGGGSSAPKETYLLNNATELREYTGGEVMKYKLSAKGTEWPDEPESTKDYNFGGTLTRTIGVSDGSCGVEDETFSVGVLQFNDVVKVGGNEELSVTTHARDNGIFLSKDSEGYISDCRDLVGGTAPEQLPESIFTGANWQYDAVLYGNDPTLDYEYKFYTGNYFVSEPELISTPFGNIEAYKVSYTENIQYAHEGFGTAFADQYEESGVLWIHPDIGIVKAVIDYEETGVGIYTTDVGRIELTIESVSFAAGLAPSTGS